MTNNEPMHLTLHRAEFLSRIKQNQVRPALKSYNDTLLFYYLGILALQQNAGDIMEIGVGGSTYVLLDLAQAQQRKFVIVDLEQYRLNKHVKSDIWPLAPIEMHRIDSLSLSSSGISNLSYCHIDGDKKYEIALNDLEYCTEHLAHNGLICQDDYGNNRWPNVADAVQTMIHTGKLVMLLVGDSSAWLTKPEYYDHWMKIFGSDAELGVLAPLLNITESDSNAMHAKYLYMTPNFPPMRPLIHADWVYDYYDTLIDFNHPKYLQMPYRFQSMMGAKLRNNHKTYLLSAIWNDIRGPLWPEQAPDSQNDIDALPDWLKDECKHIHNISDIYAKFPTVDGHCTRIAPNSI